MIPRFQMTDTSNVHLVDKVQFNHPPGKVLTMQPNRPICLIVCSVKAGGVDVFFGSNSAGADSGATPDLHFGQTNAPVWIPVPLWQGEMTLVAIGPANPVQATFLVGGP